MGLFFNKDKESSFAKCNNTRLIIHQHKFSWREKFDVYDANKKIKYTVKGDIASLKHRLRIYNERGKEIGLIKEKLISVRFPFTLEKDPVDFILEINGEKIGKISSRWALGTQKYVTDFNGWVIKGDVFNWRYQIYNNKGVVATVAQKLLSFGDTYVIDFVNPDDELLVLMVVMALDASHCSRNAETHH